MLAINKYTVELSTAARRLLPGLTVGTLLAPTARLAAPRTAPRRAIERAHAVTPPRSRTVRLLWHGVDLQQRQRFDQTEQAD